MNPAYHDGNDRRKNAALPLKTNLGNLYLFGYFL